MDKQALDRYLTTEPDNGYDSWIERVMESIQTSEISEDDINEYWDKFFDPLFIKLSTSGHDGAFPTVNFASASVYLAWKDINRRYPFLLPIIKNN